MQRTPSIQAAFRNARFAGGLPFDKRAPCAVASPKATWRELVELYRLTQPARNLQPRYNIAPTTVIDAVKWYCLCLKFDAIDLLAPSTMSYSCRGVAKLYGT